MKTDQPHFALLSPDIETSSIYMPTGREGFWMAPVAMETTHSPGQPGPVCVCGLAGSTVDH